VGNNVIDWKTDIALNANIIQAYDAELARRICINVSTWAVHDGFGVCMFNTHKLYDHITSYFSLKINQECNNPFIVI
jgi:hypothetical protein